MDISVTKSVIEFKLSVYVITVLPEGKVSQNLDLGDLGFSFHLMSKNG